MIDLIVIDADIHTMDLARPRAQALAVAGGRIVALGTTDDIRALAEPRTVVIDAGGRMVLPGLQDSHIHLQDSGQDYAQNADLTGAATGDDIVAVLAAAARTHARPWVNGTGWYAGIFDAGNLDAALMDRALPDRPSLIMASDGHNGCVNSAAMAAIGLTSETPDPPGGTFVRDANGNPTGHLYETAVAWVEARMPAPTDADFAAGVIFAMRHANRHGITGVLDARVEERHVRVYRAMAEAEALNVRVGATALIHPHDTAAGAVERLTDFRHRGHGLFAMHSAKFFLDGVIENRTAAMIAPYSDSGENAPLMFDPAHIDTLFSALDAARFQIHVHAIGDLATRAALNGMAHACALNGAWPSLHQIAHIQFIDRADIPRFAALGVMANVQPLWAQHEVSVDDIALPAVGPERGRWMYAFRSLLDAGAPMALSSDWGVSTLNPFQIMHTAITRRAPGGGPAFLAEQRLTRAEALRGYTTAAADATWRGTTTGMLSPGRHADLILLDRDILTCAVDDIAETEVLLTLLGGRIVHDARP